MAYDFSELKEAAKEAEEWLRKEFRGLRTGRATPALLDGIVVDAYGAKTPLAQIGAVAVEDARTLRVSVWDQSLVKEVEKAITNANLGVGVTSDEQGVRVSFPELTSERRDQLARLIKERLEHARVSVRHARDEVWQDLQKQEKDGEISEDEKFRYKEEMEQITSEANKTLDELARQKEEEIRG